MVDSAAEKDGATPSAPAPSSEPGSATPSTAAKSSASNEPEGAEAGPSDDAGSQASDTSETSGSTNADDTVTDETSALAANANEPDTLADGKPEDELDTLAGKGKADSSSADESGARATTPSSESTPRPRGTLQSDASTARKMPTASSATDEAEPPGELAPAESDVPPPPRPATSNRRPLAKTMSLDTPADALTSEAATEKRHAARPADEDNDIDGGWGSGKPGLPPRPRTPRPRPASTARAAPLSSSPASMGLGARPLSKRPIVGSDAIEDAAVEDEPETAEASRPAALAGPAPASPSHDEPDADATAALPPHQASHQAPHQGSPSSTPAAPGSPGVVGPTAAELHREDEDDPTIVNYPQGGQDDERTAVHPSRGPFVAPLPGLQDDTHLEPKHTAEFPPGFNPAAFASREAAMEAALAAATGKQDDESKPLREQQIVVAIATLLGVGMVLGALGAYLTARAVAAGDADAGASLAGANVVCCISLFAAGFASLQPKQQARIGLCAASGAMLLIGFISILGASMG